MGKWTRRAFIGAGALVGGGFVLGVTGAAFAPAATASVRMMPRARASSPPGSW